MGADAGIPYGRRLTELAGELGEAPALVVAAADGSERTLGWTALERRANQVARLLARPASATGDLLAVGLPSNAEHVVTTFAAWKLGATVLPLRPELPGVGARPAARPRHAARGDRRLAHDAPGRSGTPSHCPADLRGTA